MTAASMNRERIRAYIEMYLKNQRKTEFMQQRVNVTPGYNGIVFNFKVMQCIELTAEKKNDNNYINPL